MTKLRFLNSTALALACALSLAACNKQDASTTAMDEPLPLTNAPPTAIVEAPPAEALPEAPRPRIAARAVPEDDDYSYMDRAYAMSDAIGDAPPDYGFDYRDSHPWVWRSTNRSTRMVEPVSGGYRDYYYQPGADRPYLVRDPQYAYGFSNGELVAVYDRDGRLVPYQELDRRDEDAGRILARAAALYDAATNSERRAVNAANWAAQQARLANERAQWRTEQNQQESWRAYHTAHAAQDQDEWKTERVRRDQSAQSFNDWRARGYSGPPPPVTAGNRGNPQQDQARAQQQADQARQQQDQARQAEDRARQQQQQDQARQEQQRADQAHQAQDKARQQQQQDQARQEQDKARQQQDQARQAENKARQQQQDQAREKQQQDQARQAQDNKARQQQQADQERQKQQQDQAREAEGKARAQQQQADQARQKQQQDQAREAEGKARAQQQQADKTPARQAEGRNPRGSRATDAPAPVPPVAAATPAVAPAATPPVAAAPPAAVVPPAVALRGDSKAQKAARARKKLADEARARDGKPPQP